MGSLTLFFGIVAPCNGGEVCLGQGFSAALIGCWGFAWLILDRDRVCHRTGFRLSFARVLAKTTGGAAGGGRTARTRLLPITSISIVSDPGWPFSTLGKVTVVYTFLVLKGCRLFS